jgi:hypothetical protein
MPLEHRKATLWIATPILKMVHPERVELPTF